jgi:DNA-binding Lrp family transcriptional regulator
VDALDEAIVELLETDGRLTHREIAETVGTSRSAAAMRLQRLMESGLVTVRGVVHPAVLGRTHLAHVTIEVDGGAVELAERVCARDDAAFVSLVTGRPAVVLELRNGSSAAIDRAVTDLRVEPGVRRVETLSYLEVLRDVVGPVGRMSAEVDDTDLRLLAALQEDGRASYVALAELVGLSAPAVRRRVQSLQRERLIKVGALVRQSGQDRQAMMGLGLNLAGDPQPVVALLSGLPQITFVARTLGRFDILAEVRALTGSDLVDALDVVRRSPHVRTVESWTHLRVVKETYAQTRLKPEDATDESER